MTKDYVLAIDIGTQSSRAALVDLAGNILVSSAQQYDLETPAPGWAQQDARTWWKTTAHNIRQILAESGISPNQIAAIAADGQMHGTVPMGPDGEVLTPAVQLWCDKRNAELVAEQTRSIDTAKAYNMVGNLPSPAWQGWKVKWVQCCQPEVYAKTWKFLTASAYITYLLCGVPVIDYSEASGTYLMDANKNTWDPEMFKILDISQEKMPDIYPWSKIAGFVNVAAARETGLLVGTPVAAGGADMMTTLLAAGLTEYGQAVDSSGTASMMCIMSEKPVPDTRLQNLRHGMPGWVAFGIVETGGGSLKWFKDAVCQEEIMLAEQNGGSPYKLLDIKAEKVAPGSEGLLFYPYLLGERNLGTPYSRGVFFGITPRTGKGAMARAVMEGVIFDMRRTLEIAENTGVKVTEIRSVGGGAQSPLWCQIRADIYQKPVAVLKTFEGGILGSAIVAGIAAGAYPDERTAAQKVVQVDRIIEPNRDLADRYNQQFQLFKDLHDRMMDPFERLARLP